jgi:transcriptional regulator with XRE-family HTH domain
MYFEGLLQRLRDLLKREVRNGNLTERGLARRVGLSQSHIHNVLKGVRILSPSVADRILNRLGLTVEDLLIEDLCLADKAGSGVAPQSNGEAVLLRR